MSSFKRDRMEAQRKAAGDAVPPDPPPLPLFPDEPAPPPDFPRQPAGLPRGWGGRDEGKAPKGD
jgi:hypothetical protein